MTADAQMAQRASLWELHFRRKVGNKKSGAPKCATEFVQTRIESLLPQIRQRQLVRIRFDRDHLGRIHQVIDEGVRVR